MCWRWQWWHRLRRSAPGCRPAEERHHQQPGLSQAGPAWGHPHSTGVPRAAASSNWLLSASSEPHVAGHLGHSGHRSESQSCDSAGDTTAATQGRGTSPEVPWGRTTSHSMLDSGALSPSSPSSLISAVSSKKKEKKVPRSQVSGVGGAGSNPQPSYSQLQLLLHLQKDIRVWEAV